MDPPLGLGKSRIVNKYDPTGFISGHSLAYIIFLDKNLYFVTHIPLPKVFIK